MIPKKRKGLTEVVIDETHFSVSSDAGVPGGDWFEPSGKRARGANVAGEGGTEGTNDSH